MRGRSIRLFASRGFVAKPLGASADSGSEPEHRYVAKEPSPLIVSFIKDDAEAMQFYSKYLEAYNAAVRCLAEKDYEHAQINIKIARSSLFRADIVPKLTGVDLGQLEYLSNLVADNLTRSKC